MASTNVDAMQNLSLCDDDTLMQEFTDFIKSRPSKAAVQSVRTAIKTANLQHTPPNISYRFFDNLGDEVMSHLPLIDLLSLGNTNRSLGAQVPSHLTRAFHALLRRYFPEPAAFRDAMRDSGAVISGSSALAFIMRDEHWTPKDLDIYTPSGAAAQKIVRHLQCVQGFEFTGLVGTPGMPGGMLLDDYAQLGSGHIRKIYKFARRQEREGEGRDGTDAGGLSLAIDLIESSTMSAVQPIACFHSTLVMNFFTADAVVVLYPSLTFARIGIRRPQAKDSGWVAKYTSRGFRVLQNTLELGLSCGSACPRLKRSSYDVACCRIHFGIDDSASEHGYVAWLASWTLGATAPYGQDRIGCNNGLCPHRNLPPVLPWAL